VVVVVVVMAIKSLQYMRYGSRGYILVVDDVKTGLDRLQPHRRSCWRGTPLQVGGVDLW